jgi:hypothetical protein
MPFKCVGLKFQPKPIHLSQTNLFQFVDVTICRDNIFIVHLTLSKEDDHIFFLYYKLWPLIIQAPCSYALINANLLSNDNLQLLICDLIDQAIYYTIPNR